MMLMGDLVDNMRCCSQAGAYWRKSQQVELQVDTWYKKFNTTRSSDDIATFNNVTKTSVA